MENLEKYFIEFKKLFRKIMRSISENFDNHYKKFRKILRNTSEIYEKYFRNFEKYFLKKFRIIFWKNKNTYKILENNLITL